VLFFLKKKKKKSFGTHSHTKFGWRGANVSYIDARKKMVLERRYGLRPSEKERRSGAKNTPAAPLSE
jgi:hypothetical protein